MSCTILLSACTAAPISHQQQLKNTCKNKGGDIVTELTCPTSQEVRDGEFCLLKNSANEMVFFNGCTAGIADYDAVFFNQCLAHDLCYHHEPATNGKSKNTCDQEFYQAMEKHCEKRSDTKRCLLMAKLFYEGVEHFGESSWQCSNLSNKELESNKLNDKM
ncbi:MAG: hypothetical protein HWE10_09490 [Gammaproteobacteria bacterium]|nr:hypothetical protein [Gammaproteobacteria bacterium]